MFHVGPDAILSGENCAADVVEAVTVVSRTHGVKAFATSAQAVAPFMLSIISCPVVVRLPLARLVAGIKILKSTPKRFGWCSRALARRVSLRPEVPLP